MSSSDFKLDNSRYIPEIGHARVAEFARERVADHPSQIEQHFLKYLRQSRNVAID